MSTLGILVFINLIYSTQYKIVTNGRCYKVAKTHWKSSTCYETLKEAKETVTKLEQLLKLDEEMANSTWTNVEK